MKVSCIGDYQVFDAKTDNISLSGALLLSPLGYSPGEQLVIVINAPCVRKMLTVAAEVIWSTFLEPESEGYEYQVGVKYLYLSADNQKIFSNFLATCS